MCSPCPCGNFHIFSLDIINAFRSKLPEGRILGFFLEPVRNRLHSCGIYPRTGGGTLTAVVVPRWVLTTLFRRTFRWFTRGETPDDRAVRYKTFFFVRVFQACGFLLAKTPWPSHNVVPSGYRCDRRTSLVWCATGLHSVADAPILTCKLLLLTCEKSCAVI